MKTKTLERLESLTPLEIIDRTERLLVDQGVPSVTRTPSGEVKTCVYLSPDGHKCAAGQWIVHGEFPENGSLYAAKHPDLFGEVGSDTLKVMLYLQDCHDAPICNMTNNKDRDYRLTEVKRRIAELRERYR